MDTLTIIEDDEWTLADEDSLRIDQVTAHGSLNGTGTLITDCLRLLGTIESSVRLACYAPFPSPLISVTRVGTDSLDFVLDETVGAGGYLIQWGSDPSFTDPSESFFADSGPKRFGNLLSGTTYWLRGRIHGGTTTSVWSGSQSFTTAADSDGVLAFDAAALSPTVIRLRFPTISGPVDLRRRPTGSEGEWTTVAENCPSSPYDDVEIGDASFVPNVQYDYQWRVAGRSWLETDTAWLTRTFDRSICVGRIVSAEALPYKIIPCETEVMKGIE